MSEPIDQDRLAELGIGAPTEAAPAPERSPAETDEFSQRIAELHAYKNALADAKTVNKKVAIANLLPSVCDAMEAMLTAAREELTRAEARVDGVLEANAAFVAQVAELKKKVSAEVRARQNQYESMSGRLLAVKGELVAECLRADRMAAVVKVYAAESLLLPWYAWRRRRRLVMELRAEIDKLLPPALENR